MGLEAAVSPRSLTAKLHYLKRGDPPPGVPQWNGIDDEREVHIEDARGRESEFTLDRNGFTLVKAQTAVADFYDPVWRPVRGPVLDSPLALCDAGSFTDDDLIASDLVYAHVRGETSRVEFKPNHRWYYFSEMQKDEALLIRIHDSANDGRARLSFHTSFENPLAPAAPPRESIEVRALVFFPPTS